MRMLLVFVAIVASSACRSAAPSYEHIAPTAQFALAGSDSVPPDVTVPATVRADGRRVEMLGMIEVPTACHSFSARVIYEGPEVVALIAAKPTPGSCIPIPAHFAFRIVQPLNPGEYSVRIMFAGPEAGSAMWPITEQRIAVGTGS